MSRRKIVVTIPAFNEESTIEGLIREIKSSLGACGYQYKILVVDDGSTDATAELARKSGAVVLSHPYNCGLGETFRTEIKQCLEMEADIIVHIDADGQYRPSEIPLLINEIENGSDLVLGSRFMGTIEHMPFMKRLGNKMFSSAISQITRFKIRDAQTGFRAFTSEVARKIEIKSKHTYTQEQLIKAVKNKFRIKEIPVYFAKRKDKSRLINTTFGYAAKAWINIFRIYRDYSPLKTFGLMGSVFFAGGFALGLLLLQYFFATGTMPFTGSLVLTFLLLTVGLFIILFGFLADMRRED